MKTILPLFVLFFSGVQLLAQIVNTYSFAQGDTTEVVITWDAWAESGDPIIGCNIYRIENLDVALNETLITSDDSTFFFTDTSEFNPYFPPKYIIKAVRATDTLEVAFAHAFASIAFSVTDLIVHFEAVVWNTDTCCMGVFIMDDGLQVGFIEYQNPFNMSMAQLSPLLEQNNNVVLSFFSDIGPYADLNITNDFIQSLLGVTAIAETSEPFGRLAIYPNPVSVSSTVSFYLLVGSHTNLEIFNLAGKKVHSIVDSYLPHGVHRLHISRHGLTPGLYFIRLNTVSGSAVARMLVK